MLRCRQALIHLVRPIPEPNRPLVLRRRRRQEPLFCHLRRREHPVHHLLPSPMLLVRHIPELNLHLVLRHRGHQPHHLRRREYPLRRLRLVLKLR